MGDNEVIFSRNQPKLFWFMFFYLFRSSPKNQKLKKLVKLLKLLPWGDPPSSAAAFCIELKPTKKFKIKSKNMHKKVLTY